MEFLKRLLELAPQIVGAERAEAEGRFDRFQVFDPDRGALTQILQQYAPPGTPVIVERVVEQIDAIVKPSAAPAGRRASPATAKSARQLRLVLFEVRNRRVSQHPFLDRLLTALARIARLEM